MFDTVLGWGFGALVMPAALIAALAMGAVFAISKPPGRNAAIDGLRGYLATGVVAHHAVIYYFFVRGEGWGVSRTSHYFELGGLCVKLFFMITAFLFVGKLLDARRRPIDWLALFTARVLRLTPLYLVAMAAIFLCVGVLSGWRLRVPLTDLILQSASWLAFAVRPDDINGLAMTSKLTAGVTWTLGYEWMFYLALPLIALILRLRVGLGWVIGCAVLLLLLVWMGSDLFFPNAFVSGAIAALLARQERIAAWLRRPFFGAAVVAMAAAIIFEAVPPVAVKLLLIIVFCLVACGNTAMGLLSNRAAIALGEISYGVYLLHGLVLNLVFRFVLGWERTRQLTPELYWTGVLAVGMITIATAAFTYRFIELPSMRHVGRVVERIRSLRRRVAPASEPAATNQA
jgi:peptidoglycan/LPS O-acetylase OafA/YrhL